MRLHPPPPPARLPLPPGAQTVSDMDAPGSSRRPRWVAPAVAASVALLVVAVFPRQVADALASTGVPLPSPVVSSLQAAGVPLQGESEVFEFLHRDGNDAPVTWHDCTIDWVFDPAAAPDGSFAVISEAFDEASALSGVRFRYAGEVSELPQQGWVPERRDGGRFAPVVVAWASPASTTALTGAENAVALPAVIDDEDGKRLVGGAIVFNRDTAGRLPRDFSRGSSLGAVALHEIGHLLGLAHVDDRSSLMHGGGRDWRFALTEGDRDGFAAAGAHCSAAR